jgi:hypothetical protein
MTLPVFPSGIRGLTWPVLKSSEFNTLVQEAANKMDTRIAQTYNPFWHWELVFDVLLDNPAQLTSGFTYTDYRTLQGFFLSLQGSFGDFLLDDPSDDYVGPALSSGSPNTQAELQLVSDGAGNYYSPVQRNFGGQFYEDVTDLNGSITVYADGTLQSQGPNYSVQGPGFALAGKSYMGLVLQWASPAAWQASHAYALNAIIMDPAGHLQKCTTAGTSGATIPTFNDSGSTTNDNTVIWTDQGYNPGPASPVTAQFNFYFRCRFEEDTQDFEQFLNQMWTIGGSESKNGSGYLKICSSRPAQI